MDEAVLPTTGAAERPERSDGPAAYQRLRSDCRYYLGLAAAAGVGYAVCFTGAGGWGLNFPVYFSLWCVLAHKAARRLGLADPRREALWYGGIVALALSVFWTENPFLQFVSAAGIAVLQCFWALSLAADVRSWHFTEAASAAAQFLWRTLRRCLDPLRHYAAVRGSGGRQWRLVLLGLGLSLPMAAVALMLMSGADAVFRSMLAHISLPESFWTAVRGLFRALLVLDGFYAALCAQTAAPAETGREEVRRFPALVAVTFLAVLAALYSFFSVIQIRVLFLRGGTLPDGCTYAQYAREGFFQLLALSALNVGGVIVSQRRFESSRWMRALLCVIGGCTFVMEFSSAWRMALYVQVYGLTFPRILVLWFLAVLAVILAGTLYTVFHPRFRLFSFSLIVCLAAWLAFVFARPDNLAARYDLARFGASESTVQAIRYDLGVDALEELTPYLETVPETIDRYMDGYLDRQIPRRYEAAGVRGFNWSLWQAHQTAEVYRHEQ